MVSGHGFRGETLRALYHRCLMNVSCWPGLWLLLSCHFYGQMLIEALLMIHNWTVGTLASSGGLVGPMAQGSQQFSECRCHCFGRSCCVGEFHLCSSSLCESSAGAAVQERPRNECYVSNHDTFASSQLWMSAGLITSAHFWRRRGETHEFRMSVFRGDDKDPPHAPCSTQQKSGSDS